MWITLADELKASRTTIDALLALRRVHGGRAPTAAERSLLELIEANETRTYPLDLFRNEDAQRLALAARREEDEPDPLQCIAAILAAPEARDDALARFASTFPRAVWLATPAGRRWLAEGGGDAFALTRGLARTEPRLARLVRDASRRPNDPHDGVHERAIDPSGRFRAVQRLRPTRGFTGTPQQLRIARRDRPPLFIVGRDGSRFEIPTPKDSWAFGDSVRFASHGDEVFVLASDLEEIHVLSRTSEGAWIPSSCIRLARRKELEDDLSMVLLDDDHVWRRGRLFRRLRSEQETQWRQVARCDPPLVLGADRRTLVVREAFRGAPLVIARGEPYVWEERITIRLPLEAHPTDVELDGADRLVFEASGRSWCFERDPVLGWQQRAPDEVGYRATIDQALPTPDVDAGAQRAVPYVVGSDHPVGTWIRTDKLGVGVVIERDASSQTLTVRFGEGPPRRFKVR